MSDVLDRIRRELLQRLESTRAAAQEHERVRAALEALEHGVKPLEQVTRRAAGAASRRARGSAGRARTAGGDEAPATAGSDTAPARPARSPASSAGRAAGTRKPTARKRAGRSAASASTAKAGAAAKKTRARAGAQATPARARAPRGANREAVLAVVRERPGVSSGELAAASGVSGGTLYALLRRLTDQGEVAKRELPGGQTGYVVATGEDVASSVGAGGDAAPTDGAGGADGDGAARPQAPAEAATAEEEGQAAPSPSEAPEDTTPAETPE